MKTLYLAVSLTTLLLAPFFAEAQGGSVGIGTAAPDASAVLDLTATGKGLLIPRLDSAARVAIASPATGLLVFQTGPRQGFYYYGGSAWLFLPDKARGGDNLGSHAATQNLNLQGNALTGTGASIGSSVGVGVRADGGLNIGQNTVGNNVLVGYQAGNAITQGFNNTFSGYRSGYRNTGGNSNVFSGHQSGFNNTLGLSNVFEGLQSGYNNTTGNFNQFVGARSGLNNTTGSNNWAFGYQAGPTTGNLTNAGAIGYQAQVSQDNSLVLGGTGANAVNVGIGTTAPTQRLEVAGQVYSSTGGFRFPDNTVQTTAATDAQQLSISGSTLSLTGGGSVTVPGDDLGNHTATQALNLQGNALTGTGASIGSTVGLGVRADGGLNIGQNTGGNNVLIGYQAGQVLSAATGGFRNTFLGHQSGYSATTGGDNVFIGFQSGLVNTTGFQNTYSGSYAGVATNSGSRNAFFGFGSGEVNTTGGSNAFFGSASGKANTLGSGNCFFGYLSGENNTVGGQNVFVGTQSGQSSTTGSRNTFVGHASGYNNGNGQNNWALGYDAGPTTGGLSNAGAIGYQAQVSQSNSLVLGGTGNTAVKVGIGTTAPAAPLEIQAGTALTTNTLGTVTELRLTRPGTSGKRNASADLALGTYAPGTNAQSQLNIRLGDGNSDTPERTILVLRGDGRVGIGTLAPAAMLDVGGDAQVLGTLTAAAGSIAGRLVVGGNSALLGGLTVDGAATLSSSLAVGGPATLSSSLAVGGTATLSSLAVSGTSTLTGKVTTAAVTTPAHNGANLLAAGYGNVFGAGTYTNDSGNVSVSHPGTGEYLITFSGPLATADFGSTAVALTLFNGPGFVSYTSGGAPGVLRVRTYSTAGTLTDRGFSFVVFQP